MGNFKHTTLWRLLIIVQLFVGHQVSCFDLGNVFARCRSDNPESNNGVRLLLPHVVRFLSPRDTLEAPSPGHRRILNTEEVLYIREVLKLADISGTPLGQLLANDGVVPEVLGNIDPDALLRSAIQYTSSRKVKEDIFQDDDTACLADLQATWLVSFTISFDIFIFTQHLLQ